MRVMQVLRRIVMSRRIGFTLSEVLITLGIIGVIAAMTIPTLIQKQQEKTTVVALKKAYSTLSQAYTLAVAENGTPDTWTSNPSGTGAASVDFMDKLAPYLRITKNCGTGGDCFPNIIYYHWNGTAWGNANTYTAVSKAQLIDGSLLGAYVGSTTCTDRTGSSQALQNTCSNFYIDTNGMKGPNIIGKDFFLVSLTKYGMIPVGTPREGIYPFGDNRGWGFTAWVIYNENMDYLHCNDLAWGGKTKCN